MGSPPPTQRIFARLRRPAVVCTAATAVLMVLAYAARLPCFGPDFDPSGVSGPDLGARAVAYLCYSDIQALWDVRDLNLHLFPYVHGAPGGGTALAPGTVEYPVLSGVLIYLLALPASTDFGFYTSSALVLGAAGLLTSAMLARAAGWRALWFAAAPALVLYAFLNWDLVVVAVVVGAVLCARLAFARRNDVRWLALAALLLAAGGAFKFYPLMFAAPIAVRIALPTGSRRGTARSCALGAAFLGGVGGMFVLMNLPFALVDLQGWLSAYRFQWSRPIDASTQSIWYWGFRPGSDSGSALQSTLATASSAATALGLAAALVWGATRAARTGVFPWLHVAAAMLCAYVVLNKVHSPQYILWLLPFLVLLRVRGPWIVAYMAADVAVTLGWYLTLRYGTDITAGLHAQLLVLGVWVRPVLLGILFVRLLRTEGGGDGQSPRPAWRNLGWLWLRSTSPQKSARSAAPTHPSSR